VVCTQRKLTLWAKNARSTGLARQILPEHFQERTCDRSGPLGSFAPQPDMTAELDAVPSKVQPHSQLLGSTPDDISVPARLQRTSGQRELISSECKNTFLICPIPIRERTGLDMKSDGVICLVY
jgi:hypothetical protein